MNPVLRRAFEGEMSAARGFERQGLYEEAFRHLERAHVLGQRHVVPHTRSHWRMFLIGVRRRDLSATWGQAIRMVLGAVGSAVGRVPSGNTGGTNISMFRELPIDPELAALLEERRN
jgi:hypothetical protein